MEQLPKIVQRRLRATQKPGVHPDPDLLAAFTEKSLNDRERVQVLQHLAECADCRDVVKLAMPEIAATPLPGRESSSWLSWPVLRWGALAACVVVVGAAVTLHYDRWPVGKRSVAERVPAVPTGVFVESDISKQPSGEPATKAATPLPVLSDRDSGAAARMPAEQSEKKNLNAGMVAARTGVSAPHGLDSSADQPAAPAPAVRPAEQQAKTRDDARDYTARASNQTVSVEGAAASPMQQKTEVAELKAKDESSKNELHKEVQTGGGIGGAVLQDRKADALSAVAETVEVTSGAKAKRSRVKANSRRWTISPDGNLQRSFDSGKTWQTIPVASGVVFRAMSANDSDIWVGGSAGALYHSSDAGEHWTQIKPIADGKSLTSDIVAVEFSDARHGRLTTSNRETWITGDAGETWQRR